MGKQNNLQSIELDRGLKKVRIIIVSIILTALIIGSSVYVWQRSIQKFTEQSLKQQIVDLQNQIGNFQQANRSSETTLKTTQLSKELSSETEASSSLESIDQTWNLYTNNEYGFSIKVPKKMFHSYGSMCEWKDGSYRPRGGIVPVKIFEDKNIIYISSEYFYKLGGETVKNGIHYYSECYKVINTLSRLKDKKYFQQQSWEIIVKNVSNDNELENFIKERYGSGCRLGDKNVSNQPGVFDVSIQGDGKSLEETKCPLNYMTVLKYYPAKNKVVSWNLGQTSTFITDESYQNAYDQEMVDSFRFQ